MTADVVDLYRRHLSTGRAKIAELFGTQIEVRAKGAWVETDDGSRYLNAGGYGVFIHGARHPHVEAAVIEQIRTNPLASLILLEPKAAFAAAALKRVVPDGLERVQFAVSGADAVEAAIKLARTTGRKRLVAARHGYHGKTFGALSLTANELYQDPFRPLLSHVSYVPFGSADALEEELRGRAEACVVLEPVQGEGGVRIPPDGYLRDARAICDRHGALLVFDEIQTGLGRLGYWWGADREQVTPDILLAGKGLSGGMIPVAAMIATREVFRAFDDDPFIHASTFGAAPIAMAAARAAIEAIETDRLVERSASIGSTLLTALRQIVERRCNHLVNDVRGLGLLIGVEMKAPGLAGALMAELLSCRLIVNHSHNADCVLRLTPPAIMTQTDIDFLLASFEEACSALAGLYPVPASIGSA